MEVKTNMGLERTFESDRRCFAFFEMTIIAILIESTTVMLQPSLFNNPLILIFFIIPTILMSMFLNQLIKSIFLSIHVGD